MVGDEPEERSLKPDGWSWWNGEFRFRLDQIHVGEDESNLEWMSDPDVQGTVRLSRREKEKRGSRRLMVPLWDPDNPDAVEAARIDDGLHLEPLGLPGAPVRLSFRGRNQWPFPGVLALVWGGSLILTVVILLRFMEWWIL